MLVNTSSRLNKFTKFPINYELIFVNDGSSDIKYNVQQLGQPVLAGNIATNVRNKIVLKNNEPIYQIHNYNQFENKGYAVTISEFKCSPYTYEGKYGASAGSNLRNALYIIDMQIEIHKKTGSQLDLYDVVDFQKTIFVVEEFI